MDSKGYIILHLIAAIYLVARLRRRGDAEAHLKTLQRMVPHVTYEIVFDVALIRRNDNCSG